MQQQQQTKRRTAVITGAGSGIGRATVRKLYNEGYCVLACDVNADGLTETVKDLNDSTRILTSIVDVSKEDQVKRAVELCIQKYGIIHVMFANAGVSGDMKTFFEYEEADLDFVFRINVHGVFYCFKHAYLAMEQLGVTNGSLIATSSVAGIRSGAGGSAYSASKAAVINMVQTIANQLYGTGIRCNAICPGLIETGMTKIVFDMADARGNRKKIGQLCSLQRYGVPEEIASVAAFLASSQSSYVTGQAIAVDGGLSSSHPVAFRKKGMASM